MHLFLYFVANLFIKQLGDVTITSGQKLILVCELNAKCKNVQWYKTNSAMSYRYILTDFKIAGRNAHRYKLEINKVKIEDAGEYRCHIENVITSCNVMVKVCVLCPEMPRNYRNALQSYRNFHWKNAMPRN